MAFTSVIKGLHTNSLYGLNLFLSRWAWKRSDWWSRNWERSCRVSAETADLLKTGGLQLHRVEGGWGWTGTACRPWHFSKQTSIITGSVSQLFLCWVNRAAELPNASGPHIRVTITFVWPQNAVKCQTGAREQRLEMRRTAVSVGCLLELYSN